VAILKVQVVPKSRFAGKLLLAGIIAAPFIMIAGAALKFLKIALISGAILLAVVIAFCIVKWIAKKVWSLI
jgi:hypothetical protein